MSAIFEPKRGMVELVNDANGMTELVFFPSNNDMKYTHALDGELYECVSWSGDELNPSEMDFIADFSVKWDGCSHWYFIGQDKEDKDSYYHLCGVLSYIKMMRSLVFAYELMVNKLGFDKILEKEELEKLRKLDLLKGYAIKYH